MPNLYHSDLHLPRWKRLLLWLFESPTGQAIWGIPLGIASMAPVMWWGIWWPIGIAAVGLVFAFGWNCARRRFLRDGRIDPL